MLMISAGNTGLTGRRQNRPLMERQHSPAKPSPTNSQKDQKPLEFSFTPIKTERTVQVGKASRKSRFSILPKHQPRLPIRLTSPVSRIKEGDILTSTISTNNMLTLEPVSTGHLTGFRYQLAQRLLQSGSIKGSSAIDKSGEFTLTHAHRRRQNNRRL